MSSSVAELGGASTGAGDWTCSDSDCRHVNFARRTKCNRCQRERSVERNSSGASSKKKLGTEIGKAAAEKSRGLFSAEDWQCSKCANVNWARRQTCNMCNAPKFCDVEERTGYGGGYNDRGVVEYKERSESDSEYDEFGRLKKRKRKLETPAKSNNSRKSRRDSNDDLVKHVDEVDKKIKQKDNKIKTKKDESEAVKATTPAVDAEEEDEEEEEEDDDSGDLSKYDLWGDEDIVSNVKARKSRSRSASTSSTSSSTSSSSSSSSASSSDTATSRSRSRSSASHSSSASSRRQKAPRTRSRSPSGSGRRR